MDETEAALCVCVSVCSLEVRLAKLTCTNSILILAEISAQSIANG